MPSLLSASEFASDSNQAETRRSRGWFESESNEEAESGWGNSLIYDKHVEDQVLCVKCSKIWNNKSFQIVLGWFGFKADWTAVWKDTS